MWARANMEEGAGIAIAAKQDVFRFCGSCSRNSIKSQHGGIVVNGLNDLTSYLSNLTC